MNVFATKNRVHNTDQNGESRFKKGGHIYRLQILFLVGELIWGGGTVFYSLINRPLYPVVLIGLCGALFCALCISVMWKEGHSHSGASEYEFLDDE